MNEFPSFRRFKTALILAGLLAPALLHAQSPAPSTPLPANWQRVGSVATGPDQATLKTTPGTTILTGSDGQPYLLAPTGTGDFHLAMDVLMTPGANLQLMLPVGQAIDLTSKKLSKAPGLWQTVEVFYRGRSDQSHGAILEKLAINGVTVTEGKTLAGTSAGSLGLAVSNGSVAVRQINFRPFAARSVAKWNGPVSYTIVEGQYIGSREEARTKKVLKTDTTSMLNYEVSYGQPRQYTIFFSGKLNALQAGDYQFELNQGGQGGVWIDGKQLIPIDHRELGQPSVGNTTLTAGPHDVQVYFSRSWFRPGLGLFVSQAGTRPQPLHALASLPEPDPIGVISVVPETKSEMVRSFVQMPGEKMKRTHSLSVGSPAGLHYTLDLDQMALLQAWKGDFANVTEMWYERGEPQLLSPMGTTVHLPGQIPLMVLTSETTAWPDSVGENILHYKGLTVDKDGSPTIDYELAGMTVTDAIRPSANNDALVRTLSLAGSPDGTTYCRLAVGSSIEEVSKGMYAVNDRSYYIRFDPKAKVKMRQSNGKQELLMPVAMKNGAGSVQYSIVF